MVGPLPLAPHHDYLQYAYHIYIMQAGSKSGCYTYNIDLCHIDANLSIAMNIQMWIHAGTS